MYVCMCSLCSWDVHNFCCVYVFCTCAVAETVIFRVSRECYPRINVLDKNDSPHLGCSRTFTVLQRAFCSSSTTYVVITRQVLTARINSAICALERNDLFIGQNGNRTETERKQMRTATALKMEHKWHRIARYIVWALNGNFFDTYHT